MNSTTFTSHFAKAKKTAKGYAAQADAGIRPAAGGDIDRILSQLEGVRKTGRGWVALCPVHADHSPSLSIRDTGDRVLLYCYARCRYRDICEALGIGPLETDRDLMATKRERKIAKLSRLRASP